MDSVTPFTYCSAAFAYTSRTLYTDSAFKLFDTRRTPELVRGNEFNFEYTLNHILFFLLADAFLLPCLGDLTISSTPKVSMTPISIITATHYTP